MDDKAWRTISNVYHETFFNALTKEKICAEDMSIISVEAIRIRSRCCIGDGEKVQLVLATWSCCVDWKQDRPCDTDSDDAGYDRNFEMSEKEVAVQSVRVEHY